LATRFPEFFGIAALFRFGAGQTQNLGPDFTPKPEVGHYKRLVLPQWCHHPEK
jgi:hypothetical protein